MSDIQVGEYVRTNKGYIRKIDKIEKCSICEEKIYINTEIIKDLKFTNTYHKEDIVKHSKNIIDLIEVGDIVNDRKVYQVGYNFLDDLVLKMSTSNYEDFIYEDEIKTILTKEQYQANCYEVESEE